MYGNKLTTKFRWITRHPSGIDGMEVTLLDPLATSYLNITKRLDHLFKGEMVGAGTYLQFHTIVLFTYSV